MRFKKYIKESNRFKTTILQSFIKFKRFPKVMEKINDILSSFDNEIPNARHKELKSYIGTLIEDAFAYPTVGEDMGRWMYREDIKTGSAIDFKRALKKIDKIEKSPGGINSEEEISLFRQIASEIEPIVTAFDKLTPVKRKVVDKKQQAKDKFIQAISSSKAVKMVHDVLDDIAENIAKDYEKEVIDFNIDLIKKYQKADDKNTKLNLRKRDKFDVLYNTNLKENGGKNSAMKNLAKRTARDLKEAFLQKNIQKLANIIEMKSNLKKVTQKPFNKGSFEGYTHFDFADGSGFTVVNKVVVKQNYHGTVFYQFPTTFHNVVMPDGSNMKQPSEKRMITVFAKG
jgi:hypothetical protein